MDYEYTADVLRVVDGDTVYLRVYKEIEIDFGFRVKETSIREYSGSFRLARIDTPEMRGKKARKKAAKAAKNRLEELLKSSDRIIAKTYKKPDNFGRYLVELICVMIDANQNEVMTNINDQLVNEGHAVPYRR